MHAQRHRSTGLIQPRARSIEGNQPLDGHLISNGRARKTRTRLRPMKTITSILATAALLTGIAVAGAQTSESQKTLDSAGGAERNPDGSAGGSKTHPSPGGTTGAASQPANPRATSPATDPANPSTQRNPDGSAGGS